LNELRQYVLKIIDFILNPVTKKFTCDQAFEAAGGMRKSWWFAWI
jgi:hypothetical protein